MTRRARTSAAILVTAGLVALGGCNGDDGGDGSATQGSASATTTATTGASASATMGTSAGSGSSGSASATGSSASESASASGTSAAETTGTSASTGTTSGAGCGVCDEPNQSCVDDVCVTSCQGQDPDPCGPDQVCDVISGECVDPGSLCTVSGATEACGAGTCGPGTVCDGQGTCVAVAPCVGVECTGEGDCWGTFCACERAIECQEASADLLNGPFSADVSDIDFADDCNAWSVTLSGGQEFLRKLTPAGDLQSWGGVGDYDQGEVRVLRLLKIPQATKPPGETLAGTTPPPPEPVEGLGEVALTYVCCPSCGDCANNPNARGVARLDEGNVMMPLPIVLFAEPTQGMGPFQNKWLDGGPQGLTWGEDRVLYVGKRASADNVLKLQDFLTSARARTASVTRLAA
ncbi:MAG: hypothetical protein H6711_14435 [Myxococcales bacterium]|nr:hypothetical protein [Myxococcales bacterium]